MIERNDISKLWKQQHHFSRCTWSTISLSLPSLTSLQLSAIYLSPLGGETKIGKTNKAWLLDIEQKKSVKMLVQQVTREEKDTPLHCGHFNCDRSCFRLPRIGVKPLELEKVRKIGKSAQNWQKQQQNVNQTLPPVQNPSIWFKNFFSFSCVMLLNFVFFLSEMSSSLIIYVNQQAKEIIVHSPL